MLTLLNIGIGLLCGALLLPLAVFIIECGVALWPRWGTRFLPAGPRPRTVVLIPAHNEEAVIGGTLNALLPTLGADDFALVVADNCTDQTAEVARRCGAKVVERQDLTRRGKGFALNAGVRWLEQQTRIPEAVVVLDADCRVDPHTVELLARVAATQAKPAQCLNLCEAEPGSAGIHAISNLGFRFKNLVRPTGLARLGLPCILTGTGMAFPWHLLQVAPLDTGELAEDMQLGVALAIRGTTPVYCPEVRVLSALPRQESAFVSQRTRWEQGHLRTMLTQVPRLLWEGLRQRRFGLFCQGLDLLIPPFSLLIVCWMIGLVIAAGGWLLGASAHPLQLLAGAGALAGTVVLAGWSRFCRDAVSAAALLSIPVYMLKKLPIYAAFLFRRGEKQWVRTAREPVVEDKIASPSLKQS